MRRHLPSLIRFGVVGLFSNLLLYIGYLALTTAGAGPKLAMTLMFCTGVALTFVLNQRWSFAVKRPPSGAFARYAATYIFGYVVNLVGLLVLVDRLGFRHDVVQAILIVVVALLMFALQRTWVFRVAHPVQPQRAP